MKPLASLALTSVALLTACAGSNGVRQPVSALPLAMRPATQTIVLKPTSLSFGLSVSRSTRVAIAGGAPPYALRQSNAEIADISKATRRGRTWSFDVTPIASGTTIVTVGDVSGAATALPVNQQACVPPAPEIGQIYPPSGASNVSPRIGFVYVSEPSSDPLRPYAHQFYARLVGSDGSVASGNRFSATRATPPPGSATLPTGSILLRSAIPALRRGITYRILYPTRRMPCLGPLSAGLFTT
jgi:hypothetical protein